MERRIKFKIKCPYCGYKGEPRVKYEKGFHRWYCPKCGRLQE